MSELVNTMILIFAVAFIFDISFNLRRLLGNLDRLWRKLDEIQNTLQKNI